MPDLRRATCRNCHRHRSECGPISWNGNCQRCAHERMAANLLDLVTHSGAFFEHYRRRMVAAFGGVLVDDTGDEI